MGFINLDSLLVNLVNIGMFIVFKRLYIRRFKNVYFGGKIRFVKKIVRICSVNGIGLIGIEICVYIVIIVVKRVDKISIFVVFVFFVFFIFIFFKCKFIVLI